MRKIKVIKLKDLPPEKNVFSESTYRSLVQTMYELIELFPEKAKKRLKTIDKQGLRT